MARRADATSPRLTRALRLYDRLQRTRRSDLIKRVTASIGFVLNEMTEYETNQYYRAVQALRAGRPIPVDEADPDDPPTPRNVWED